MATGLPRVTIQPTRDLTYRVPPRGGTGVGCIVVNARKGPVDEPVFVANETEYLRTFCPDETISVGDDEAHYSALNFLREGAGLWVVRPSPNGVYAALRVDAETETGSNRGNYGLTTGAGTERRSGLSADNSTVTLEDLLAAPDMPNDDGNIYTIFAKSPGKWGNNISVAFAETEDDTLDLPSLDFRKTLGDDMPHTFTIPVTANQNMTAQTVYLPTSGLTGTPTVTGSSGGDDYAPVANPQGEGQFEFDSSTGRFRYQARTQGETVKISFDSVGSGNLSYDVAVGAWAVSGIGGDYDDVAEQTLIIPDELDASTITHAEPTSGATAPSTWTPVSAGSVDANGEYYHDTTAGTIQYCSNVSGRAEAVHAGGRIPFRVMAAADGSNHTTPSNTIPNGVTITSVEMERTTTFGTKVNTESDVTEGGEWSQTGGKLVLHYGGAEAGTLTIATDFDLDDITLTPTGTGLGALGLPDGSVIEDVTSINLANNVGRLTDSIKTGNPTSSQFKVPDDDSSTRGTSYRIDVHTDRNLRGATVFGKYRTAEEKSRARQLIVSYKGPGDDAPVEQERFTVSHYKDLKDSYGRSVYAPDSTASSKYIAVKVNARNTANIPMETIVYAAEADENASPPRSTTGSVAQERTLSQGADGNGLEGRGKLSDSGDLYEKLVDVDNYGFSYIMDGGEDGIRGTLAKIAEERKDCVAVLSANPDGDGVAATGTATAAAALKGGEGTKNSFAAMYSPHVEIYDKFNDRNLIVPPDGFAAAVMARTARNNRPWTAPAGSDYGSLRSFPIVSLAHRYSEKLAGNLYDRSINPIIFKPGEGHLIFGQKTTQLRPSALDRLNVRLLLNETLTRIKGFLTTVVFKENDIQTRSVIRTRVGSYMARVQAGRGVYSYQVVCDDTNNLPEDIDSNVLNVWVMMKPRKTSEYVNLLGVLTPTGASFSEAQGQL